MYLVIFPIDSGDDRYLFFWTDPRPHGCTYSVVEGTDFIDLLPNHGEWHLDTNAAPHVLARSNRSPLKFKAFRSELDVPASWDIVDGVAEVWSIILH
jgi:hypothetical protein